jgi:hypothetical protein
LNDQFEVDHVPLNSISGTPPNGYHESIHLVPQSDTTSNPPNNYPPNGYVATPGYGQLFDVTDIDGTSGTTPDTQLYFLSGGGALTALTRNFQPVSLTNGYTFLPGGLIFQWGITAPSTASQTITFATSGNINFPKNIFNIQVTANKAATATNVTTNVYVNLSSVTLDGFQILNANNGTLGYYWQALGN